jgi:hypothetical protein
MAKKRGRVKPVGNYPLTVGTPKAILGGRWVVRYSEPNHIPYCVWKKPMPRISDVYTDCAVYIYRSVEDARNGERQGGSGFLASYPVANDPHRHYVYAVTNKHVVKRAKTPVIRLNRKDGTVEYVSASEQEWTTHEDGDDIAVLLLAMNLADVKYHAISTDRFLTQEIVTSEDVGIGDDTFMVGRFVNHEGKQQNTPSVRFGNIAMMPKERIQTKEGLAQEAFLVEVRSLPGYSGSAVFIYSPCASNDMSLRRSGMDRMATVRELKRIEEESPSPWVAMGESAELHNKFQTTFVAPKGPYLLGVDFCHLHRRAPVREKGTEQPHSDGWYVEENTGMAGVIPAWKIAEVLEDEELAKVRKQAEEELRRQSEGVSLDVTEEHEEKGRNFTKADFEDALKKVSRKIEPEK